MTDQPPVLRMKCQWCGSSKHAVQYTGARLTPAAGGKDLTFDQPGVCLVCPVCDSAADAPSK